MGEAASAPPRGQCRPSASARGASVRSHSAAVTPQATMAMASATKPSTRRRRCVLRAPLPSSQNGSRRNDSDHAVPPWGLVSLTTTAAPQRRPSVMVASGSPVDQPDDGTRTLPRTDRRPADLAAQRSGSVGPRLRIVRAQSNAQPTATTSDAIRISQREASPPRRTGRRRSTWPAPSAAVHSARRPAVRRRPAGGGGTAPGGTGVGRGVGVGAARARGGSSPTMALGWMLRSWLLLPDPSSCSVRMCHGAPETSPAPSRTPPADEVPVAGLREVAAPRQEDGRALRAEVDDELGRAVAPGRPGVATARRSS